MFRVVVANAGDDFGSLFPFFDEIGDEFRRLLAVGVHRDCGVAFRVFQAGGERRLFTEVTREGKDFRLPMFFGERLEDFQGAVSRAVVHQN